MGCVILSKIAFKDLDYVLVPNVNSLEILVSDYLKINKLNEYDNIYITDLSLYDPALSSIANSPLKNKVLVFDHHKSAIDDKMNRYDFTHIVESDQKGKRSGTDLFYEYLVKNNLIVSTEALNEFVELIRLEDTWEWKTVGSNGIKAHDLAILFNVIGIDNFISRMLSKLLNNSDSFEFDEDEKNLIQNKKEEYDRQLNKIMLSAEYFVDEYSNKFSIVFADYEYRNELAEYVKRIGNPEAIKYIIIVAMNKGNFGQKSYRSIDEDFDVNEIAVKHGGGGHPGAASVNITEEQKERSLILSKKESLKYLADSKYSV